MQEMRDVLLKAVKEAFAKAPGKRKIRVVFKQEKCLILHLLLGSALFYLPPEKRREYLGVESMPPEKWNEYWSDLNNRTTTIEFTELFVGNYYDYVFWFCDRLHETIASVEVVE